MVKHNESITASTCCGFRLPGDGAKDQFKKSSIALVQHYILKAHWHNLLEVGHLQSYKIQPILLYNCVGLTHCDRFSVVFNSEIASSPR